MPEIRESALSVFRGRATHSRWPSSLIPVGRDHFSGCFESGVRDHAGDLIVVSIRDDQALAELALRLGELRRKDMAHLGLVPLDLAGTSLGEALGRARMGLQFGHCFLDFGPT